jgi:hypothetical protein
MPRIPPWSHSHHTTPSVQLPSFLQVPTYRLPGITKIREFLNQPNPFTDSGNNRRSLSRPRQRPPMPYLRAILVLHRPHANQSEHLICACCHHSSHLIPVHADPRVTPPARRMRIGPTRRKIILLIYTVHMCTTHLTLATMRWTEWICTGR